MRYSVLFCLFLLCLVKPLWAGVDVYGLRLYPAPDHTRMVWDLSGEVKHKLMVLPSPNRVVIDLLQAQEVLPLDEALSNNRRIKQIRSGQHGERLRIVLDVRDIFRPEAFLLKPEGRYGYRFVVDLWDRKASSEKGVERLKVKQSGLMTIAIDAGHGGEDPGAIGQAKTREKRVVLAIAKRLQKLINQTAGMKAVLIRKGDYYVGLRKRIKRARRLKADVFVSIHADSAQNKKARGASVYVLSNSGASSEFARWLARKENATDLIGGIQLSGKDKTLNRVLLDLAQSGTIDASYKLAGSVLKELKGVGKLHKSTVQAAGFAVLKSANTPSVLVETAFISNRKDEKRLRSGKRQQQIATAIFKGIKSYLKQHPPLLR
jgi:N-acetylmuramoyl-L-alanine amidase